MPFDIDKFFRRKISRKHRFILIKKGQSFFYRSINKPTCAFPASKSSSSNRQAYKRGDNFLRNVFHRPVYDLRDHADEQHLAKAYVCVQVLNVFSTHILGRCMQSGALNRLTLAVVRRNHPTRICPEERLSLSHSIYFLPSLRYSAAADVIYKSRH